MIMNLDNKMLIKSSLLRFFLDPSSISICLFTIFALHFRIYHINSVYIYIYRMRLRERERERSAVYVQERYKREGREHRCSLHS